METIAAESNFNEQGTMVLYIRYFFFVQHHHMLAPSRVLYFTYENTKNSCCVQKALIFICEGIFSLKKLFLKKNGWSHCDYIYTAQKKFYTAISRRLVPSYTLQTSFSRIIYIYIITLLLSPHTYTNHLLLLASSYTTGKHCSSACCHCP